MKALCLPFQALRGRNTLVGPSADRADRCFGSLSLRQDAAVGLTRGVHPAGAHVPSSRLSEVLWFTPKAVMGLQKRSPLAVTFTAEGHQQLSNSPHTPRLRKSLSRASTDRHPFFLGCHMNTSGLWLSSELFCSGGPSYDSDIPQKTGHLKRYDLTSDY